MSIGRDDYEERREARVDRMEARAAKQRAESDRRFAAADSMAKIMNGQPIIIGHHSEKRTRRDYEKIAQNMDKGVEAYRKAEELDRKAEAARENAAISSDDPEAVEKLERKLSAMQAAQERDKTRNAWYRKHKTMRGCPGIDDERAEKIDKALEEQNASPYSSGKNVPVPAWVLSNRNAEMRRVKERLESLRRVDEMEHTEIEFPGGKIVTNEDVNRIQILFDEKPDEETRSKLKRHGFHWSRREGAWQILRNPLNLHRAFWALDMKPEETSAEPAPETEEANTEPAPETEEASAEPAPEPEETSAEPEEQQEPAPEPEEPAPAWTQAAIF